MCEMLYDKYIIDNRSMMIVYAKYGFENDP